jgi:hypothetical protein
MAEWWDAASAEGEGGGGRGADAGGAVERRGEWPGEADLREDVCRGCQWIGVLVEGVREGERRGRRSHAFRRVLEGEADQIVGGAALHDAGCGFAD